MSRLTLKDSSIVNPDACGVRVFYHQHPENFIQAVDELNRQLTDGEIQVISLNHYSERTDYETPVSYQIRRYRTHYNRTVVDECVFFASHYVGYFSFQGTDIELLPRFGNNDVVFNYLLSCATKIYIPHNDLGQSAGKTRRPEWLLAILWKGMLEKALIEGQIPKEYRSITKNRKFHKGKLDIHKHIRANLTDASKFYCTYKKLTFDNTINRTIRSVYSVLSRRSPEIVADLEAYDCKLASMGVESDIDVRELSKIRYTKMTIPYRPVMELSRSILEQDNSLKNDASGKSFAYFIDIAELWEMYLLRLLQRALPDCVVYSPNERAGDYLISGNMREIRPDIIIEKCGRVLAIIDAKYKLYSRLGHSADQGIQRDDLYQMTTYMYHYGEAKRKVYGIFTAPVACDANQVHRLSHDEEHNIGLINLPISDCCSLEEIYAAEEKYINEIKTILQ